MGNRKTDGELLGVDTGTGETNQSYQGLIMKDACVRPGSTQNLRAIKEAQYNAWIEKRNLARGAARDRTKDRK